MPQLTTHIRGHGDRWGIPSATCDYCEALSIYTMTPGGDPDAQPPRVQAEGVSLSERWRLVRRCPDPISMLFEHLHPLDIG
jgi:hypothetical protein